MKRAGPIGAGFFIFGSESRISCEGLAALIQKTLKINPHRAHVFWLYLRADWVQILPPLPKIESPVLYRAFLCLRSIHSMFALIPKKHTMV
jgi:hypothetical protein